VPDDYNYAANNNGKPDASADNNRKSDDDTFADARVHGRYSRARLPEHFPLFRRILRERSLHLHRERYPLSRGHFL
jgi:hypothetical protein